MGRQPCCEKAGLKKGSWTEEEDRKLFSFILNNGQCPWRAVPKLAGLLRCGKSCRLRWKNYLRPGLKRGVLSESEEKLIVDLHAQLGNRWSKIARNLPGRTDNEIKNYWNTHIKKKLRNMGIDPITHKPLHGGDQTVETQNPRNQTAEAESKRNGNDSRHGLQVSDSDELFSSSPVLRPDEMPMTGPHEIVFPWAHSTNNQTSSPPTGTEGDTQLLVPSWPESMYLWELDGLPVWDFFDEGEQTLSSASAFD
ncbi:hypothetical protein HPP92_023492 [Vanilla planifolia]|uniref:Uncharacterized protein n=1 Tax=Vanilla planifolia TaxID=51239 RepID=A0A835UEN6_VANPL|nr:hypothetical protein HPP92_023492 [Vanilla planifolia]